MLSRRRWASDRSKGGLHVSGTTRRTIPPSNTLDPTQGPRGAISTHCQAQLFIILANAPVSRPPLPSTDRPATRSSTACTPSPLLMVPQGWGWGGSIEWKRRAGLLAPSSRKTPVGCLRGNKCVEERRVSLLIDGRVFVWLGGRVVDKGPASLALRPFCPFPNQLVLLLWRAYESDDDKTERSVACKRRRSPPPFDGRAPRNPPAPDPPVVPTPFTQCARKMAPLLGWID